MASYFRFDIENYIWSNKLYENLTDANLAKAFQELDKRLGSGVFQLSETTYKQDRLAKNFAIAVALSKPMLSYEGGPHLVGSTAQQRDSEAMTAFLQAMNRNWRMGNSYRKWLDRWFASGGDGHIAFVDCSDWSKWGSWGHLEYQNQNPNSAVKYKLIRDYAPVADATVTPQAPTNLSANVVDGKVNLKWKDHSGDECFFAVYRREGNGRAIHPPGRRAEAGQCQRHHIQ